MSYKTTKKDFKEFKAECEKWIDYFSLNDWDIYYRIDSDNDCRGACTADSISGIAIIGFGREFVGEPEKFEIKGVAFHEVCELLLSPMRILGENRYVTEEEMETERHRVIHILQNTIFKEKTK